MTSRHGRSLTMFSIAFMVMVFVLTQTVSHSFPKLCAALQRKFGTDAACRAGCRHVFGLVSREQITAKDTVLDFFSGDAMPACRIGKWQISASIQRIATRRTLAAMV